MMKPPNAESECKREIKEIMSEGFALEYETRRLPERKSGRLNLRSYVFMAKHAPLLLK